MFAELKTAAAGIALAIAFLVGLTGGWSGAWLWAENWTLPAARDEAREAGITEERVKWTELQNRVRAKLDADRQAAQDEIAAREREFHQREQARQADMIELEAALADERNNATPIPTPSPGAACACRPAISRGVRDRLQPIGRGGAASRAGAGVSETPLR